MASMEEFLRDNGTEIDAAINSVMYQWDGNGGRGTVPDPAPTYDDDERENWVLNDEGLYEWARSEGALDDDEDDDEDDDDNDEEGS